MQLIILITLILPNIYFLIVHSIPKVKITESLVVNKSVLTAEIMCCEIIQKYGHQDWIEGHFKAMLHSRQVDLQKIPHAQFVGIFIISLYIYIYPSTTDRLTNSRIPAKCS